jgi:putative addiction module CopG family antidote
MNVSLPLPPHLERFVREQLASGRYQNEDDVILAALQLLEAQTLSQESSTSRRSPRGVLGDLPSTISPDEIKEARREMWSDLPHDEA